MADYRKTLKRYRIEHTLLREVSHPRTWEELLACVNQKLAGKDQGSIGMTTLKADLKAFEEMFMDRKTPLFKKVRRDENNSPVLICYTDPDEPFPFLRTEEPLFLKRLKQMQKEQPRNAYLMWLLQMTQGIQRGVMNGNVRPCIQFNH